MLFAKYRAGKKEKRGREYLSAIYPPGYKAEPRRHPDTEYRLKTTKEELCRCLMMYDRLSKDTAEQRATQMLKWLPQSLAENLDEAVQRKPLSNIIYNGYETLCEDIKIACKSKTQQSVYFAIFYLSGMKYSQEKTSLMFL